jgi:hypothetical protein
MFHFDKRGLDDPEIGLTLHGERTMEEQQFPLAKKTTCI